MKYTLFVNHYTDSNPIHDAELDACLRRNSEHPLLRVVHVESETKPTFSAMFDAVNAETGDADINIIANADIFFDDSIGLVEGIGERECYALSRWIPGPGDGRLFDSPVSQDVWIVRGRVTGVRGDFPMGTPGCDNRIAFEFHAAGWTVSNPSRSIRAYHLHTTSQRWNDSMRLKGGYRSVRPTALPMKDRSK